MYSGYSALSITVFAFFGAGLPVKFTVSDPPMKLFFHFKKIYGLENFRTQSKLNYVSDST